MVVTPINMLLNIICDSEQSPNKVAPTKYMATWWIYWQNKDGIQTITHTSDSIKSYNINV